MADSPGGERTEKATPRRRKKALDKGQVALSQEVNSSLVLLAGFSLLFVVVSFMGRVIGQNARYLFSESSRITVDNPGTLLEIATANLGVIGKTLAPVAGGILLFGFVANVLQVGWNVNLSSIAFRLENINPINGIKQVFSKKAAFELFKNLLKIGIIAGLSWYTVSSLGADLMGIALMPLDGAAKLGWKTVAHLVYRLVAVLSICLLYTSPSPRDPE